MNGIKTFGYYSRIHANKLSVTENLLRFWMAMNTRRKKTTKIQRNKTTPTTQLYINWPVEQWKCDVNQLMVCDIHLYSSMPKHHFMYSGFHKTFFSIFIIYKMCVCVCMCMSVYECSFSSQFFLQMETLALTSQFWYVKGAMLHSTFLFSNWRNIWKGRTSISQYKNRHCIWTNFFYRSMCHSKFIETN